MSDRELLRKFFDEGYWKNPLYAYRLWRAENHRWGSMKGAWEYIGRHRKHAYLMVDGSPTEDALQTRGGVTALALQTGLRIELDHKVLEMGCGVARIGRELAPHCGEWWGCDISTGMIRIAGQRTSHLDNVHLVALDRSSLDGFEDNAFDRTYCHVVFMHLDQATIYQYVLEMARVTKPGGIIFFDGLNLLSQDGWQRFAWEAEHFRDRAARPIHHSRFTTPLELCHYAEQAGLGLVDCCEPQAWVHIIAAKYPDSVIDPEARGKWLQDLRSRLDLEAMASIPETRDNLELTVPASEDG